MAKEMMEKNLVEQAEQKSEVATEEKVSFLTHILNGIGYMLPCVVAGGILMGLGFMLDDISLGAATYGHNTPLADFFSTTGSSVFGFMLPVLAAGIAYSIGGIHAIADGLAGGYLASQGTSGFLGALAAGFVAGYVIRLIGKLTSKMSENLDGVKTLLIIPLASVILMGAVSVFLIEPVVGFVNGAMNAGLLSMSGTSKILLGLIIGGMASVDMGGPVNKTAYLFATASLANGQYDIMAAALAGEFIPPYVTAFASTIFRSKFTKEQRQAGITNYIIGLAGITEAAIPFWAADTVPVLVSCVIGSAIAGAMSMALGCSVMAPFGGIFILPLNSNILGYVISLASGIAVGTVIYGVMKKKPQES